MSADRAVESRQLVALFRMMMRDVRDRADRDFLRRRVREELFNLMFISYKRRKIGTFVPAAWRLAVERLRGAIA
jgi:hypothetical protein